MKDISNQKFGRLTVLKFSHNKSRGRYIWECICECGTIKLIDSQHLRYGRSKSCGCLSKEVTSLRRTTHGMSETKLYKIWTSIKNRCFNKNDSTYGRYGGRGITICKDWMEFTNFKKDMQPTYKEGLTIDRIDNSGNYDPSNCRWATVKEQNRNRRSNVIYNGICAADASKKLGGSTMLVISRIRLGWSIERAFTTPLRHITKKSSTLSLTS